MSRHLEEALIEALDLLEQGMPLETILARDPQTAVELRPYLQAAAVLEGLATSPSLAAQQDSRALFLSQSAALAESPRPAARPWLRRILAGGLALLLLFFAGGSWLALSAGAALPGENLYGAKLYIEEARLDLARNPEAAAALNRRFRAERAAEVAALIAQGRRENVVLGGFVQQMDGPRWLVEGVPVAIGLQTTVHGAVEPGFEVQVRGITGDGALQAMLVEVVSGRLPDAGPDEPLPQPGPGPTAVPVDTAVPGPTPAPTLPPPSPTPSEPTPPPTLPPATPPVQPTVEDQGGAAPPAAATEQNGEEGGEQSTPESGDDETPEPERDDTPEPDHDETPEPDHDDTPEPEHDETPEPEHDETPEPDHDETPQAGHE